MKFRRRACRARLAPRHLFQSEGLAGQKFIRQKLTKCSPLSCASRAGLEAHLPCQAGLSELSHGRLTLLFTLAVTKSFLTFLHSCISSPPLPATNTAVTANLFCLRGSLLPRSFNFKGKESKLKCAMPFFKEGDQCSANQAIR